MRKQLEQIVNVLLDGVEIDSTLGSLSRLANAIWIVDAMEDHKQGVRCLDLFKVYCIGKQIMGSDRTTCRCIQEVREMLKVVAAITDPAYTGANKLLPIARPMGDNSDMEASRCPAIIKDSSRSGGGIARR